jgi:hypothetical protein
VSLGLWCWSRVRLSFRSRRRVRFRSGSRVRFSLRSRSRVRLSPSSWGRVRLRASRSYRPRLGPWCCMRFGPGRSRCARFCSRFRSWCSMRFGSRLRTRSTVGFCPSGSRTRFRTRCGSRLSLCFRARLVSSRSRRVPFRPSFVSRRSRSPVFGSRFISCRGRGSVLGPCGSRSGIR